MIDIQLYRPMCDHLNIISLFESLLLAFTLCNIILSPRDNSAYLEFKFRSTLLTDGWECRLLRAELLAKYKKYIYIFIVSYNSFRREHLGGEKTDYFFLTLAEELQHAQPQLSVVLRILCYPSDWFYAVYHRAQNQASSQSNYFHVSSFQGTWKILLCSLMSMWYSNISEQKTMQSSVASSTDFLCGVFFFFGATGSAWGGAKRIFFISFGKF